MSYANASYGALEWVGVVGNESVSGFGTVDHERTAVVVAFAGTRGVWQLWDEADMLGLVEYPGVRGARVVAYFLEAAMSLFDQALNFTTQATASFPGYNLYFTGHSLGGAIAAITAFEMRRLGAIDDATVYTFGQPRTGNEAWAQMFNALFPQTYRVVNSRDPVPHLPTQDLCSPGNSSGCPFHHGTEIWYPEGDWTGSSMWWGAFMCAFKECTRDPFGEDPSCSNSNRVNGDPKQHSMYWNVLGHGWCAS